jgi:CheY-like chemotaxis protein
MSNIKGKERMRAFWKPQKFRVMCTAFVQQSDKDKTKAAGMDQFCTKPINMVIVRKKLKSISFF